ncbi:hypothetical protein Ccar_16285 [Clostridium carboxidivorans P7]|uniref:DnaA N-terminal domain-containing protein n=2 Tax=Clostridium TaxID=1485 RepID=C6PT09_9CLOT|nr:DnaA N-terminal domain-containing protein [Clostridium carboxidivorans]AKN32336.1 hypothetical protein Ccar_16285 [Clostridium carboxidivorans P7]EET87644.1 hypothetical protein CcarbDRAFT_1926 [Clostridium carboxidivorans P7]
MIFETEYESTIKSINKSVLNSLKDKYNNITISNWLFYIENSFLDQYNDLVISVPNDIIRMTIKDGFADTIEKLYRDKIKFDKLIIFIDPIYEEKVEEFLTAKEVRNISAKTSVDEMVDKRLQDINESIKRAANNGENETCLFLTTQNKKDKEIYDRINKYLNNKGYTLRYSIELGVLQISW